MAKTDVDTRKQQRKEELRAYLSNRGKVDYVLDNIEKIEGLDCSSADFQKELAKLKTANEQRIRLLNKYLPDAREDIAEVTDLPPLVIKLADSATN
jgi:phenylalanyl-tRNA synthetase beta subunit